MTRGRVAGTDADPPEAVFLAWLSWLPDRLDAATAALCPLVQHADEPWPRRAPPLGEHLPATTRQPKQWREHLRRKPRGVRD